MLGGGGPGLQEIPVSITPEGKLGRCDLFGVYLYLWNKTCIFQDLDFSSIYFLILFIFS